MSVRNEQGEWIKVESVKKEPFNKGAYNHTHFYADYKAKEEAVKASYIINKATYKGILIDYIEWLMGQVIHKSRLMKLPWIGNIYVTKLRVKLLKRYDIDKYVTNTKVDWANTKLLGKVVHYTNDHTNGWKYKFKWEWRTLMIKHAQAYTFKPVRKRSRYLAKWIMAGHHDYIITKN